MRDISRDIKGFSADKPQRGGAETPRDDEAQRESGVRPGRPLVVHKSVVATAQDVAAFGPLLAAAAHERGFAAALRKCFVADGSETNWGV